MIYIFEDRAEREAINKDVVDRYPDKICFAKFNIDEQQELEQFIIDHFHDAECILFHKSYSFLDKDVNLSKVQQKLVVDYGVKFIVFSGGTERSSIADNGVININADVMYSNLGLFLETYRLTGNRIYEILLWGEKYRLSQLLAKQVVIHYDNFLDCDLDEIIDLDEAEDIIENIESEGFDLNDHLQDAAQSDREQLTWDDVRRLIQFQIDDNKEG